VVQAEMRQLREAHGEAMLALKERLVRTDKLEKEIALNNAQLEVQWNEAVSWLSEYGFIEDAVGHLTPRGKACAAFADGEPLIIGTIISDGWLAQLSAAEIMAWLCMFLKDGTRGAQDVTQSDLPPPRPSAAFEEVLQETEALAEMLEVVLDRNLTLMMLDWVTHKDIQHIATWIDPHMLGTFVRAVMRVVSYIDVVREVCLGLQQYETHNRLDNHMDMLFGGLVTNESLYLRMSNDA